MTLDFAWENASFATPNEAYEAYRAYGNIKGFCTRKDYERKGKGDDNRKKYLRYCCSKEGFRQVIDRVGKNVRITDETRTGCDAFIYMRWVEEELVYKIVRFSDNHNHELHDPKHSHMFRCNRKVDLTHRTIAELHQDAGITLRSSYDIMQLGAGGREKVGFMKSDLRNSLRDRRQSKVKDGEASALIRHFSKRSANNPFFYYDMDFDDEEKITNIFWADARMRMDYSHFGDCVTFDTTYRTNTGYRPLGI